MLKIISLLCFIFCGLSILLAQPVSITVTNNDLALVKETRIISLQKGKNLQQITDMPGLLDPTSVHIFSKAGEFTVLEQNFEYDLLNADKILDKAIDRIITVITPSGTSVRGKLLSADGSSLVIETENKELRIIPRSPDQQTYLEDFDQQAYGLITRPTLVWLIDSQRAGNPEVELSYLTNGLSWHAEYIATLNEQDNAIELNSWVSLTNSCGKTFNEARLKLMAGDIHRAPQVNAREYRDMETKAYMAQPQFEEKQFFEYHLYTLDKKTTIKNNQTKQIQLLPTAHAAVSKIFSYNYEKEANEITVLITTINAKEQGLGIPLPKGMIRIYKKDGPDLEFIGEDQIDHTPRDEKIEIEIGKAFDIKAERTVLEQQSVSKRSEHQKIQIELRNHKDQDIEIQVTEPIYWNRSYKIQSSNYPVKSKDARKIEFTVPVKANGTSTLVFEILYKW
jgi:hypothetical protein